MARIFVLVNFILIFLSLTLVSVSTSPNDGDASVASAAASSSSTGEDTSSSSAASAASSTSKSGDGSRLAATSSSSSSGDKSSNASASSNAISSPTAGKATESTDASSLFNCTDTEKNDPICPKGQKKSLCPRYEVLSKCIQTHCKPQKCSERGQILPCPNIPKESCKKGCVCATGYLRNSKGRCIPEKKCPKVTCRVNEEFSNCTQAICRPLNCSQRGLSLACPAVSEGSCQSGCVCQSGYLKTANGDCVPNTQCYGDLICGDDEVALESPNNKSNDYCQRFEGDKGKPNTSSGPVCVCRFNHKRSYENVTCIPTANCPSFECNRTNEEYRSCPPICPTDNCSQASPTGRCPIFGRIGIVLECNPKCRCINGYWRNNGSCVPYSECPGICPTNERYSTCIQAECRALNCTQKDKSIPCPRVLPGSCKEGCVCTEGTLRSENGTCIPSDKCPAPTCDGQNEVLAECANGCDPVNCPESLNEEQVKLASCQAAAVCLPPNCRCLPDYRRDVDGKCIPIGECPGICPANEEYSNCTQAICRAQTCEQKGKAVACPGIAEGSCERGCVCSSGFLRNSEGNCIPEDKCPGDLVCADNEIAAESSENGVSDYCPRFEGDKGESNATTRDSSGKVCVCRFNYKRSYENGTCIRTTDCPSFKCNGLNEEYRSCPPYCPSDDCSQATPTGKCPTIGRIGIVVECAPKCRCIQGYWRNNGTCLPYSECPGICPTCERYSTCIQAECRALNCIQKDKPIACPRVMPGSCKEGCVCTEGTLRAENGTCVPEDTCPAPKCDGQNEVLAECANGCDPVNCPESFKKEQETLADCFAPAVCLPRDCKCLPDYRRDVDGKCIPIGECPGICPANEEYSNCTQALCRAQTCEQKGQGIACPGIAEGSCERGCVCSSGFLRNSEGNCVPEDKCSAPKCDGQNEVLAECANGCDPVNCPESLNEEQVKLASCQAAAVCLPPSCRCLPDFRRDVDGKCIPIGECPGICPANEEYSNCTQALCRAQTCEQNGQGIACPGIAEGSCERGCVCSSGFLRNSEGNCVPEDKCSAQKCDGQNEVLAECANGCDPVNCPESLNKEQVKLASCQAAAVCLPPNCRCLPDFRRDVDGKCIPIGECPGICPANEEYSNCTQAICRAQTCEQKGQGIACPGIAEGSCERGCVCSSGFLRNSEGICVSEDKCPAPKCDGQNEVLAECANGCDPVDCPESLTKEQEKLAGCQAAAVCLPPNCRCLPDYRHDSGGKCIPIGECPGICPANEEYSNCTQAICRAQTCEQRGKAVACPGIAEGSCERGCVCSSGFLRNSEGNCVPEDKCPVICPANEEFSNCTQAVCRQKTCKDKKLRLNCSVVEKGSCKSGCICQSGYLRTQSGECVPQDQCSGDLVCRDNEVVDICPNAGHGDSCPTTEKDAKCRKDSKALTKCHEPSCSCRFNYMRAENGTCIPTRNCPPFKCSGMNEEFNPCPPLCPSDDCAQATPTGRCPLPGRIGTVLQCKPDCRCKEGYWRNHGVCMPYAECPGKCPSNEEYTNCTQAVCRAVNCTQIGSPISCPSIDECSCSKGCVCSIGFLRNAEGDCVSEDQCSDSCLENEEYSTCTQAICRAQICEHRDVDLPCAGVLASDCKKACVCAEGFLKDKQGKCIPQSLCPVA